MVPKLSLAAFTNHQTCVIEVLKKDVLYRRWQWCHHCCLFWSNDNTGHIAQYTHACSHHEQRTERRLSSPISFRLSSTFLKSLVRAEPLLFFRSNNWDYSDRYWDVFLHHGLFAISPCYPDWVAGSPGHKWLWHLRHRGPGSGAAVHLRQTGSLSCAEVDSQQDHRVLQTAKPRLHWQRHRRISDWISDAERPAVLQLGGLPSRPAG